MAVNMEIRELLPQTAVVFENASYDNSIIGVTFDGRAIYSYTRMVEEFMEDNECNYEEAEEWIDYNTLGSSPPYPLQRPLIVYEEIY